jgi:hypothetical protein
LFNSGCCIGTVIKGYYLIAVLKTFYSTSH